MKKYLIIIFLAVLINSFLLISAQNETNETLIETPNITGICDDGIVQQKLGEECDNGERNGVSCSASYGKTCIYCSTNCELIEIKGAYCGDGAIDVEEECDDGNTEDSDYCSNECKKTYECTFDSDCNDNNDCTEDKCQRGECQRQNNDGKRIGNEYCLDGNTEPQKTKNVFCNENYECITNTCNGGICVELAKEPNFIEKIINWFLKLLGLRK